MSYELGVGRFRQHLASNAIATHNAADANGPNS